MNKQQALAELSALEEKAAQLRKIIEQIEQPEITKEQRFIQLINGLTLKVDKEKYPNSIFFFCGHEYMIEIEKENIWFRYIYIWKIFEEEFSMDYKQIQGFLKGQVEEHFKMKGIIPGAVSNNLTYKWKSIKNE